MTVCYCWKPEKSPDSASLVGVCALSEKAIYSQPSVRHTCSARVAYSPPPASLLWGPRLLLCAEGTAGTHMANPYCGCHIPARVLMCSRWVILLDPHRCHFPAKNKNLGRQVKLLAQGYPRRPSGGLAPLPHLKEWSFLETFAHPLPSRHVT